MQYGPTSLVCSLFDVVILLAVAFANKGLVCVHVFYECVDKYFLAFFEIVRRIFFERIISVLFEDFIFVLAFLFYLFYSTAEEKVFPKMSTY